MFSGIPTVMLNLCDNSSAATEFPSGQAHSIPVDLSMSTTSIHALSLSYFALPIHMASFASSILILLICFCTLWTLCTIFLRPLLSPLRHLPSPNQGPSLFRLLHEPQVADLEHWVETLPHNGLIRYFGLWNEERIFAASPDAIKDVLVTQPYNYVKPKLQFQLVKNVAAAGLLLQEGQEHKEARKAFGPAFNNERVRAGVPMMWNSALDLVDEIDRQTKRQTRNKPVGMASILKPVSAVSTDIIGHWAFSRSFNAVKDYANSHFAKPYVEVLKTTHRGQWFLDFATKIGPELAMSIPIKAVKTIKDIVALVIQTSADIVNEHEEAFKCGKESKKDDMLTSLIKTGHFSHTDLIIQTVHFLAAGTETIAGSTAWTMHLLSRHPHIQSRLREEIHSNIPSPSTTTTHSSQLCSTLERLPYLNAVLKESLRFHSINTTLWRQCVAPGSTILGHNIPVKTKVVFSPWATNRDTSIWGSNAKMFDPDRWLDKASSSRLLSNPTNSSYSFLTFGAGPRRCIGESFAKQELRCLVAAMIGSFEWRAVEEFDGDRGSDDGREIGDDHALTLFKILEGWRLGCQRVDGW